MSSRWGLATFALTAGCGFQISATGDGAVPPIDAPPKVVCTDNQCRLRIDSEVDFLGAATMLDVAVEPDTASPADPTRAVLTPAAYIRGAVIARGANAVHGSVGTGIDWAGIDAATVDGVSFGPASRQRDAAPPIEVGITDNQDWTYWIEGELDLPGGLIDFELRGEDIAELQIAQPGTRQFSTIATSTAGAVTQAPFTADTTGWYPFRAAVLQTNGGDSSLVIGMSTTGGPRVPLPRARIRGRVDGLRGAFVVAWDDRSMSGPATASLYSRPLLDDQINQPLAPGLTAADNLSQRWFGQVRATVAGTYQLRTVSDDGNRTFLGDQMSNDQLADNQPSSTTTVSATMRAGWNDLVVDYNENSGGESIVMTLAAAPSGVTQGNLPIAVVRPVMPRRISLFTYHDPTTRPIPNQNPAGIDVTITPDVLPGETIREVRVGYTHNHGKIDEVDMNLQHDGQTATLRDNSSSANRWHEPTTFNGRTASGPWTLHVEDNAGSGNSGSLLSWSLTVFTQDGPPQIAPSSEWVSAVQDLGQMGSVVSISELETSMTLPPGSTVEVFVRTGATTAACEQASWQGPMVPGPIAVTAARYAQLRVTMTSNGVDEPAVDYVGFTYRVASP